jgi:hypothetical protein
MSYSLYISSFDRGRSIKVDEISILFDVLFFLLSRDTDSPDIGPGSLITFNSLLLLYNQQHKVSEKPLVEFQGP